jgi:hypothetical protein
MGGTMDKLLKTLGVAWSVITFVIVVAFFLGGEWNDWKEIKEKVLVEGGVSDTPIIPAGIEVSNDQLNKLKGNLEVVANRWDGEAESRTVHTSIDYCPDGWYVVGLRGIDTDGGKFCTSCISNIEFVCRKL